MSDELLELVLEEIRAECGRVLRIPDMYPAKNIRDWLHINNVTSINIPTVHKWRRERGIRKSNS